MDHELMTMWLSVDPMADKYPSISPYAYCAWNPVKLVDPNGCELDIPSSDNKNRKQTESDILSLVNESNRSRVTFDDKGHVKLNLDGLSKDELKKDVGLSFLSDLVSSSKKYLYEASDEIDCGHIMDGFAQSMDDNTSGVVNASNNGLDSKGQYSYSPREGYDGQVILASSGTWTDDNGNNARASVLFHELVENYYRTDCGRNYYGSFFKLGAHEMAIRREGHSFNNPHPGVFHKQQYHRDSRASYTYKGNRVW